MVFDLEYDRFIDYQISLPLPKKWLIASLVTFYVIETSIVTLPLFTLGIAFLSDSFHFSQTNVLLFIPMFLLANIFYVLLFLGFSFWYSYDWFMQNAWPRRLSFLLNFGANFFVWQKVFSFSPFFGYIMLLNPTTYVAEGFRATLIGSSLFISPLICLAAMVISITIAIAIISIGIKRRLDPV